MSLDVDPCARQLLERCRPGRAVRITLVNNYGLPGELLTVEWCRAEEAQRDPDLILVERREGIPIYAYRRVAEYLRWRQFRLTARRLLWWTQLSVADAHDIGHSLTLWERTHPGLHSWMPAA